MTGNTLLRRALPLAAAVMAGASGALAQDSAAPASPTATAETVVAKVDEVPISLGELIALRQSLPEAFQNLHDEVLMEALVKQVSDEQMLANAAIAAGMATDPVVRLRLKNQRRSVLAEAYLERAVTEQVDEDAIKAAYDDRYADVDDVEQVRAAHILLDDKATADRLKQQLDDGADFATLAANHSIDMTAELGGDLGWFERAEMVPTFAEAVFAMEDGTVSGPVETAFGWHLIRRDGRRTKPVPPLDAVRDELIQTLRDEARQSIIDGLRSDADLARPDEAPAPAAIRNDALIGE